MGKVSFFAPGRLMIVTGLLFGALASLLTEWGNPANMGICVACFYRDIAGAVGLHRAAVVQYIRPEILGFIFGAFFSSLGFREFRVRGGSSPLVRFLLGTFFMIGALVFLGCPIRALLRLAGGDLNGVTALAGVVFGAIIGIQFLKNGFTLGRSSSMQASIGGLMPLISTGFLLMVIFRPDFLFFSKKGPGSLHAPIWIALFTGLLLGFLAQRTRMCFVGGWRDLMLVKDSYLFKGVACFFIGAIILNAILGGHIHWGFTGQPVAHDNHIWNFLGMTLAGLTATLLGGCPLRQTILTGEGDSDAALTVLGLVAGAGISHNFNLASSPKGVGEWGPLAVIIGLAFSIAIGVLMREKS